MKLHKRIRDERIIQLNNKIQSEAFILVTALLALSIFVKAYLLGLPVMNYVTELGILIIAAGYLSIRGSFAGYSSTGDPKTRKRMMVAAILGTSLVVTIINGIKNYSLYGDKYTGVFDGLFLAVLGVTFLSSLVFVSLVIGAVFWMEEYGQKRLEKKMENED